jgi:hypothetical protein
METQNGLPPCCDMPLLNLPALQYCGDPAQSHAGKHVLSCDVTHFSKLRLLKTIQVVAWKRLPFANAKSLLTATGVCAGDVVTHQWPA